MGKTGAATTGAAVWTGDELGAKLSDWGLSEPRLSEPERSTPAMVEVATKDVEDAVDDEGMVLVVKEEDAATTAVELDKLTESLRDSVGDDAVAAEGALVTRLVELEDTVVDVDIEEDKDEVELLMLTTADATIAVEIVTAGAGSAASVSAKGSVLNVVVGNMDSAIGIVITPTPSPLLLDASAVVAITLVVFAYIKPVSLEISCLAGLSNWMATHDGIVTTDTARLRHGRGLRYSRCLRDHHRDGLRWLILRLRLGLRFRNGDGLHLLGLC